MALHLLYNELVDEIVLNDLEPGVAAFWRTVFEQTDDLVRLVTKCRPSIREWHRQREVFDNRSAVDLDLGFATFFLNRTNRSGILDGGPIGGHDQSGRWTIAARFDNERLAARIKLVGAYRSRVTVSEADGVQIAGNYVADTGAFIYADPPYLSKGSDLYMNAMTWEDHQRLAQILRNGGRWLITYDVDERVPGVLYRGQRCATFRLAHTAAEQHIDSEYAVFADALDVPSLDWLGREGRFIPQAHPSV